MRKTASARRTSTPARGTTLPPPMTCGVSFRALGTYVELRVADPDLTDEVVRVHLQV